MDSAQDPPDHVVQHRHALAVPLAAMVMHPNRPIPAMEAPILRVARTYTRRPLIVEQGSIAGQRPSHEVPGGPCCVT